MSSDQKLEWAWYLAIGLLIWEVIYFFSYSSGLTLVLIGFAIVQLLLISHLRHRNA